MIGDILLRPKRRLAVGLEDERAARADGVGGEDALAVLAGDRAGLATFALDEANDRSADAGRPHWARGTGWSSRAFRARRPRLALLSHLFVTAGGKRKRHDRERKEPTNAHDKLPSK